ncbi:sensor histidine kinase [Enterococcus sp. AZ194]|uniref:sensor histidine kinase n=1 Tax=Enterococcus sp. AZ194 TaxID=2774629 RepID=UPI003F2970D2
MERINALCQQYTSLSEADIKELRRTATYLSETTLYQSADVFIDVYNEVSQQALVIYHKPPQTMPSLYNEDVVGMEALLKNEPGVLRTMQTSLNSIGLLAVTQENCLIKQNIYPIRNEHRTIGVIIVEMAAEEEIKADLKKEELHNYGEIADVVKSTKQMDALFIDQIEEAVLIFDANGNLLITNHNAKRLYRKLGYRDNIIGMHYDNLTVDYTTFEYVLYQMKYKMEGSFTEEESTILENEIVENETTYLSYFFKIRKVWIESESRLMVIIQDNTEFKAKEAEIISKSVAIREIHHRVKNNLQSVVSLLRIQERRTQSSEAKKVLKESVNRIMAIAATHELLSKQVEDDVALRQTIEAVMYNFRHLFQSSDLIDMTLEVDESIMVSSEQMVTISLVINELLQNIFDHAFASNQTGSIKVLGTIENKLISITVTDNGNGYDVRQKNENSLGLMIVKSYVKDKLKGKIKIESSKQGTKTCFYFEQNTSDVVR